MWKLGWSTLKQRRERFQLMQVHRAEYNDVQARNSACAIATLQHACPIMLYALMCYSLLDTNCIIASRVVSV